MTGLIARASSRLCGEVRLPGDKSISHRALIMGALAVGETRIHGLLEGDDVMRTAAALGQFGAVITRDGDGTWRVNGRGVGGFDEPETVLDLGNSGTGVRLLMGAASGLPATTFFTGDASLRRRPMDRVTRPLAEMGVRVLAREGGRLPLACTGPEVLLPLTYTPPVASAQVKSAILLAGIAAPGITTVIEPHPTRDHTETLLTQFGATVEIEERPDGGRRVSVTGEPELEATPIRVPVDPSSAAFPTVAALVTDNSQVMLPGVGTNPLRFGLYEVLAEMGADIEISPQPGPGEPVADLLVRSSELRGITVPAEIAPRMIDEYPVLAVAAACAEGTTVMNGLAELRVKESDRLAAVARGLAACGVGVEEGEDRLVVHGAPGAITGGNVIRSGLDHRIAMAFLVLGLASREGIAIDDAATIATSFPGFADALRRLGADIDGHAG